MKRCESLIAMTVGNIGLLLVRLSTLNSAVYLLSTIIIRMPNVWILAYILDSISQGALQSQNLTSICCRYRVDTDLILSELAEGSEEDSSVDGRRISTFGNVDPSTSPTCHQSVEQNLKQQEEEDTLILQVHFLALSFPQILSKAKS